MSKDMLSVAAEMIRRGGTLLSEPCKVCNGVQVKFKDYILCINCKRKIKVGEDDKEERKVITGESSDLHSVIIQKINELIPVLLNEKEISRQLDISKLLNNYLEILAKIKNG